MRVCGSCSEENPDRARFCLACGVALNPPGEDRREERRRVSVLFCDLVGFTARSEQLDVEDVRGILDTYYGRLRFELQRHGGTVEKFIGDAVMALFGAPVARGDDAERAVRAALAICGSIGQLNASDPSLDLHVRVGVATGEALVALDARPSHGEGMAAGDVVNTAARLQAAAPIDTVLVDGPTRLATDRSIDFRAGVPVSAKGKAEPLAVWHVLGTRASQGVEVDQSSRTAFVGRGQERQELVTALTTVRATKEPQMILLEGVAGIGKSRLVWEFGQIVDSDPEFVTWRQGRCLAYGEGTGLGAIGEIVKAQAGVLDTDSAATAEAKLAGSVADLVPDSAEANWVMGHLAGLLGLRDQLPFADQRAEAFTAWRRFLEALAATRPAVLVLEDLHWADQQLLDFLDHLIEWTGPVPLLVVGTARPELGERWKSTSTAGRLPVVVSLSPLSDSQMGQLLANALDQLVVSDGTRSAVVDRAAGNPLYAEEFVRMLADRRQRSAVPDAPGEEADLELSDTVEGIITARIDALDVADRTLLQDAAVLGKVGWVGALTAVTDLPPTLVLERLRNLENREFFRMDPLSTVAGERQFAFRHVLVRDVAYQHLPRRIRADRHERAAIWLQGLPADRAEDRAELLAHHWQAAHQYAEASRLPTNNLAAAARLAMRDAGERARALHAFSGAERWFTAALNLWPHDDPGRPGLLLRLGEAQVQGAETGETVLAQAADGLLALGDVNGAAEAHRLRGVLLGRQGDKPAARHWTEAALALISDQGRSRIKSIILSDLSRLYMLTGYPNEALQTGHEALALAEELGLDSDASLALCCVGDVRLSQGDPGGIHDIERAVEIADRANRVDAAGMFIDLANALITSGEVAAGLRVQEKARETARRFGVAHDLRHLECERILQHYRAGEWDSAEQLSLRFLTVVESGVTHALTDLCWLVVALVHLGRGRLREAESCAARAAELAVSSGGADELLPDLAVHALTLLANDRWDEAGARAREVLAVRPDQLFPTNPDWCGPLAFVLEALGRGQELRSRLPAIHVTNPWVCAAEAIACRKFSEAADIYADIGSGADEAYARLKAGEQLTLLGNPAAAIGHLQIAVGFYRRAGATAYLDAADHLLRLGQTPDGRHS